MDNRPKRSRKNAPNFSGMDSDKDNDRDSTYEYNSDGIDSDDSYSSEMTNQNHNKVKASQSTKSLPANRKYQF